jgi:hypothetical protein
MLELQRYVTSLVKPRETLEYLFRRFTTQAHGKYVGDPLLSYGLKWLCGMMKDACEIKTTLILVYRLMLIVKRLSAFQCNLPSQT